MFNVISNFPTGVEDIVIKTISIYPNPTKDNIVVESVLKGDLKIQNILGETIITTTKETDKKVIDVSNLSVGIYIVKLGKESCKFLKNN